jgi:hypothetical protein
MIRQLAQLSFSFFVPNTQLAVAQTVGSACGKSLKISLNGLEVSDYRKICLKINLQNKDNNRLGLTRESIKTKCELRLRQSGLELVSKREGTEETLLIGVFASPNSFLLEAEFFRAVLVLFDKETWYLLNSITWRNAFWGSHGNRPDQKKEIMQSLDELLDSFLNEYLKANAKTGTTK